MLENTSNRTKLLMGATAIGLLITIGSAMYDRKEIEEYEDHDEGEDLPIDPTKD